MLLPLNTISSSYLSKQSYLLGFSFLVISLCYDCALLYVGVFLISNTYWNSRLKRENISRQFMCSYKKINIYRMMNTTLLQSELSVILNNPPKMYRMVDQNVWVFGNVLSSFMMLKSYQTIKRPPIILLYSILAQHTNYQAYYILVVQVIIRKLTQTIQKLYETVYNYLIWHVYDIVTLF